MHSEVHTIQRSSCTLYAVRCTLYARMDRDCKRMANHRQEEPLRRDMPAGALQEGGEGRLQASWRVQAVRAVVV